MTLLNAISLLGACNPLLLNTGSAQTTEFIGYYVETTPVDSETWIRIEEDEEDVLFAADAGGRDMNIYFDQNGIPIIFYKATAELGRITGYREIRNDYGSLVYMINKLSDYAKYTYCSGDADDNVLGYIRSFKSSYCGPRWSFVAGNINGDFIRSVRNMPHDLLGFEDYFSSFVDRGPQNNEINTSYHSSSTTQINGLRIVDEINQNNTIDVIHMFATLDGIWTTYVEEEWELDGCEHYCSDFEDLCGWAGDLQSEVQRQYVNGQYSTDFESILNGYLNEDGTFVTTYFQMEDYLADQDALNIASIHGRGFSSLKYSINQYYRYGLQMLRWRDYQFCMNVSGHNWHNSSNQGDWLLKEKIYLFMGIEERSNGTVVGIDLNHLYRYSLVPDLGNIEVSIRKQFADSFYNYLTSWAERVE